MSEPILSVMRINNEEFLIEIAGHFFERTDERSEDTNIGVIKNTLDILALGKFEYGLYGEELVVRDFSNNISLVIVNQRITDFDINILPDANRFNFKSVLITFYDHAEHFKQLNTPKVVLINKNNIDEMEYDEYVKWFKETYHRSPLEKKEDRLVVNCI